MGYFPMCLDLKDKPVLLVGSGPQIQEKKEKLLPFGAKLIHLHTLTASDLAIHPAFVVAGDLSLQEAEQTAALCASCVVPVNVVDRPKLCTFTFSSMIVRGDLTVSVSTGGKAPGAAAHLKTQIDQILPEHTDKILSWLTTVRSRLQQTHSAPQRAELMRKITAAAFAKGDILTVSEYLDISICDACDKAL